MSIAEETTKRLIDRRRNYLPWSAARSPRTSEQAQWDIEMREDQERKAQNLVDHPRPLNQRQLSSLTRSLADWYPMKFLTEILDRDLMFERHHYQCGVYIIFEAEMVKWAPDTAHLWDEHQPGERALRPGDKTVRTWIRYIGMSTDLSKRLTTYASGKNGNPVDNVAHDHLVNCSAHERKAYFGLSPQEQQSWRRSWMEERGMRVEVAHVENLLEARRLEKLLIRLHEDQGVELWNLQKYHKTPPFPMPRRVA